MKSAPQRADGYNDMAWLLATCPDAQFRDGEMAVAVAIALRVLELQGSGDTNVLDTLAAANAEVNDFDVAIEWQAKALATVPEAGAESLRSRLELYRQGKPFRQKRP